MGSVTPAHNSMLLPLCCLRTVRLCAGAAAIGCRVFEAPKEAPFRSHPDLHAHSCCMTLAHMLTQHMLHPDPATHFCAQVVRLSREHALYSALTYVFTHALDDFTAPLADMVWALARLGEAGEQLQTRGWLAYKALGYLRCSLRGLQFPPGGALSPGRETSSAPEHVPYLHVQSMMMTFGV